VLRLVVAAPVTSDRAIRRRAAEPALERLEHAVAARRGQFLRGAFITQRHQCVFGSGKARFGLAGEPQNGRRCHQQQDDDDQRCD
jgi:hypothetical protein